MTKTVSIEIVSRVSEGRLQKSVGMDFSFQLLEKVKSQLALYGNPTTKSPVVLYWGLDVLEKVGKLNRGTNYWGFIEPQRSIESLSRLGRGTERYQSFAGWVVQNPVQKLFLEEFVGISSSRINLLPPCVENPDLPKSGTAIFQEGQLLLFSNEGNQENLKGILRNKTGREVQLLSPKTKNATELFQQASALIVWESQRESYEAATLMLSAMAAGIPVFSPNTFFSQFLLQDEQEGILYPCGELPVLLSKLKAYLIKPERLAILGSNAKEKCRSLFGYSAQTQRILQLLQHPASANSGKAQQPLLSLIPSHFDSQPLVD
ncbi:MAG: hypothetical protein SFY68_12895 [Candidatus Sumerlaeia bacterium]|nr:hypothetical protein [Candidatus Sumerlaeia bacterium]